MLDVKGRRADMAGTVAECLRQGPERPVPVCGRFWPAIDELAGLPFVRPVLSARNRAEARLRRRLVAPTGGSRQRTASRCTGHCSPLPW